MTDVAIIGAGMAGLVCAQQLTQAGYTVRVVEKSRGLGGRVATRRLQGTWADHGTCYLKPKGELFSRFIELLCQKNILEVWTDTVFEHKADNFISQHPTPSPRYVAPTGMSAISKFLAQGLDITLNQRVVAITPTPENTWRLTLESGNDELTAKAVVIAIPAPQALMLLAPLGESLLGAEFLHRLDVVKFSPCISLIAGYAPTSQPLPQWQALTFVDHPDLAWIGLDSSKRPHPQQPHFVLQSSANFAQLHLDTEDLQPVGKYMLQSVAQTLSLSWLASPDWMQVHRWRYAFPRNPETESVLSAHTPLPLVCCGDWCGGNFVDDAMVSGLAAANKINDQLQQLLLDNVNFLDFLTQ